LYTKKSLNLLTNINIQQFIYVLYENNCVLNLRLKFKNEINDYFLTISYIHYKHIS
jgi:hypothetical protein